MAEVVNLRLARKARKRTDAEEHAAVNRVVHGRSKAERTEAEARRRQADRHLDAHRRDETS